MPRRRLRPRLCLDQGRGTWIIRDGTLFKRLDRKKVTTHAAAVVELDKYLASLELPKYRRLRPRTVYFLSCEVPDFPIKIGMATDADARLVDAQTMLPYPAVLLGRMPGNAEAEAGLHRRFSAHHLRGEWFSRSPEILTFIEDISSERVPTFQPEHKIIKVIT